LGPENPLLFIGAGMEKRIDKLFIQWHRLGGAVLLAGGNTRSTVVPEKVIAESTGYCRESGRLTWVVLDWLIREIDKLNEKIVLRETEAHGDPSVLGVLCDAAHQYRAHPKFRRIMRACTPHPRPVIFFHRVARSPLASRLTRKQALEVFRRWNYYCSELRYLDNKLGTVGTSSVGMG